MVQSGSCTTRGSDADGPADHAVEYILIPQNEQGKAYRAEDARRIEAEAVARRMLELRQEMLAELPADAPEQKRRIWRQMAVLLASWSDLPLYRDALPDRAPRAGLPLWIYLEYVERLVMPVRYVATAAASDSVQLEVIG